MSKKRISYKEIINVFIEKDLKGKKAVYINLCGGSLSSFPLSELDKFISWLETELIPFLKEFTKNK